MRDLTSQFPNRFQDFQRFGPLLSFLINPRAAKPWTYLHLKGWMSKTSRRS